MTRLTDLRDAERAGTLDREVFWRAAGNVHLNLRQQQALLKGGVVDRIEVAADEIRIVTTGGLKYLWNPEELRGSPSIAVNYGAYEPVENRLLMLACEGADTVFDIGANTGWYVMQFAQVLAARGGTLHAFEPVPPTFQTLSRNLALNGLGDTVRLNNIGLADKPGVLTMHLPDFSGSGAASLMDLHPDETSVRHEVSVVTLDSYCQDNGVAGVDLVKCDVEGAELMVVQGGAGVLSSSRPIILLELLRKWSAPFGYHPNDVITLLKGWGYECWAWEADRLVPLPVVTDETVQTNFFFLQPGKHDAFLAKASL